MSNAIEMKLQELQEQIQEDLLCLFDGMDNHVLDDMCDIIVRNVSTLSLTND